MRYFPINLDIQGKTVVVVGGGTVATRKCRQLMAAGARVTVIAPQIGKSLGAAAAKGGVTYLARPYHSGDLDGAILVFAATDTVSTNTIVARDATAAGIPVTVVNAPQLGTFVSPAVVSRGDLLITVSTSGKAPALSRRLRRELQARYGDEYSRAIKLLAHIREKLLTEQPGSSYNKKILQALAADLPGLLQHKTADMETLLRTLQGQTADRRRRGPKTKDNQ